MPARYARYLGIQPPKHPSIWHPCTAGPCSCLSGACPSCSRIGGNRSSLPSVSPRSSLPPWPPLPLPPFLGAPGLDPTAKERTRKAHHQPCIAPSEGRDPSTLAVHCITSHRTRNPTPHTTTRHDTSSSRQISPTCACCITSTPAPTLTHDQTPYRTLPECWTATSSCYRRPTPPQSLLSSWPILPSWRNHPHALTHQHQSCMSCYGTSSLCLRCFARCRLHRLALPHPALAACQMAAQAPGTGGDLSRALEQSRWTENRGLMKTT